MKQIFLLVCICLSALSAHAQDPFETVLAQILNNNADIQSQRHLVQAQRLENSDANALADPSVDFARVWGRHSIGNKLQLDVTQSFEWPGVYSARTDAADMDYMLGVAEYSAAEFDLMNQARALLNELVYVRHQLVVINDLVNNFKSLNDAIDKGFKGGELTVLDQRKMQIENFEIDNDLATALNREQQIIQSLNALSTVPLDLSDVTDYPVQQLLPIDEYIAKVETDPNVLVQDLSSQLQDLNARVATRSRMPGFTVGYQHQAEMGDRFNGFTVGMTLPFFQNRKAKKATIERREAADLSKQMLINKRTAEIRSTYAELEIQRERVQAYSKTFGDNKYLELLLKAYNGGQISVIEYLSEIHYYHQNMLTYLESEYNYHNALSTLNCYQ